MTISIPDKLNLDNSGKYILSIRLRSDGFSFSGYIPHTPGSFFYREVVHDKAKSLAEILKDIFYANEFLTWLYKRILIVVETAEYTLVPRMIYQEKQKQKFPDFTFSRVQQKILSAEYGEKIFLYGIDPDMYEFCTRSFVNAAFYPHVMSEMALCMKEGGVQVSSRMSVVLHNGLIDIFCFRQGDLLLVNSFKVRSVEDILYYILYMWKQQGFDQEKDVFSLYGQGEDNRDTMTLLHTYLRNVNLAEIPSEVYLLGNDVVHVPTDLIALSVCEL